jgi:8-oxo-dGTP diphosphatase
VNDRIRPVGPAISADVVPLWPQPDGSVRLLLSRRLFEPWPGRLALPGVLVLNGETLEQACRRALVTKSGIAAEHLRLLQLSGVADSPERDQRGHTISVSYLAVVDDPSAPERPGNATFALAERPSGLPFDHDAIVERALVQARVRLWEDDAALARALLGSPFTTPQAAALLGDIDPGFNGTNTRRVLAAQPSLRRAVPAAGPAGTGPGAGRGRPATSWEFADPA